MTIANLLWHGVTAILCVLLGLYTLFLRTRFFQMHRVLIPFLSTDPKDLSYSFFIRVKRVLEEEFKNLYSWPIFIEFSKDPLPTDLGQGLRLLISFLVQGQKYNKNNLSPFSHDEQALTYEQCFSVVTKALKKHQRLDMIWISGHDQTPVKEGLWDITVS